MIAQGPIFRILREQMLDFFPDEIRSAGAQPFSKWIDSGSYTIPKIEKNSISIIASNADVSAALLQDIELLIDSCFEQLRELAIASSDPCPKSPAWEIVTCYYYGYYAAQALIRLLGTPTTFLDKVRVSSLVKISGGSLTPGSGVFIINKSASTSAVSSEFELLKTSYKPHEAVWKTLLKFIADTYKSTKSATGYSFNNNHVEDDFFSYLTNLNPSKAFKNCGFDWMSEIRYEANYRIGNAYTMVRSPWALSTQKLLGRWRDSQPTDILISARRSMNLCKTSLDIDALKSRSQIMLDFSNSIFALARSLQLELYKRRSLDTRNENKRKAFVKKHKNSLDGFSNWLFPT